MIDANTSSRVLSSLLSSVAVRALTLPPVSCRLAHGRRAADVVMLPAKPTAQPQRSALNVRRVGIGAAAPDTRVTNQQLESVVETSDEWIKQRTGIGCRHLLQPGEGLTGLASTAVTRALDQAGVAAEDVELLICATSTPDDLFGDAAGVARAFRGNSRGLRRGDPCPQRRWPCGQIPCLVAGLLRIVRVAAAAALGAD